MGDLNRPDRGGSFGKVFYGTGCNLCRFELHDKFILHIWLNNS